MPDNQSSAAQPESGAESAEFNFDKPTVENPRIKRRSLKTQPAGLIKPASSSISAARDLAREAPRAARTTRGDPDSPTEESGIRPRPRHCHCQTHCNSSFTSPHYAFTIHHGFSTGHQQRRSQDSHNFRLNFDHLPARHPPGDALLQLYPSKVKEATSLMKTIPTGNQASPSSAATGSTSPRPSSTLNPSTARRSVQQPGDDRPSHGHDITPSCRQHRLSRKRGNGKAARTKIGRQHSFLYRLRADRALRDLRRPCRLRCGHHFCQAS